MPNQPLASGATNPAAQLPATTATRPLIIMSFSGGGSRAAALASSVLQELDRHGDGEPGRTLLDDVVVISSVSGGSVTAAQFGLYGRQGLVLLTRDFIARDNMATLEMQAINPITWFRLAFGGYTRVDALRDLLDRQLYHHDTFAKFSHPGAPLIILNATDMASGEVFAFTGQRFDDICSNLSDLPVSVGVSASAAFPVLLSPVDLQDFAQQCADHLPPAPWISNMLAATYPRYLNLEEYKRARYANALRHGPNAFRPPDYLHLLDGGLADNLGLHSLIDVLTSPHGSIKLLNAINSGALRRIVVIEVNARSDSPSDLSTKKDTPSVISMVNSVISNPIDSATAGMAAQMHSLLGELRSAASNAPPDALFGGTQLYEITVDFDQFLPSQNALRDQVKIIPTLWSIKPDQVQELDQAAILLLHQHPCFQMLLSNLHQPVEIADPAMVSQACPQPVPMAPRVVKRVAVRQPAKPVPVH